MKAMEQKVFTALTISAYDLNILGRVLQTQNLRGSPHSWL